MSRAGLRHHRQHARDELEVGVHVAAEEVVGDVAVTRDQPFGDLDLGLRGVYLR